jgi:hypothetical protein
MLFPIHSDARFAILPEVAEAFGLNPEANEDHAWYIEACQIEGIEVSEAGVVLVFPEDSEFGGAVLPIDAIDLETTERIHGDFFQQLLWGIFNAMEVDMIQIDFPEWATINGNHYDAISFDLFTGNGEELVLRKRDWTRFKTWVPAECLTWTITDLVDLLREMSAKLEAQENAA